MGHHIQAVILKGPFEHEKAVEFGLNPISLKFGLTLFPLDAGYCDHWAEQLGVVDAVAERPLLNLRIVHHMMNEIAAHPSFAIIETDYFGGRGSQAAAVYRGHTEVMAPSVSEVGPINMALTLLGVTGSGTKDEFDTLGLGQYREFEDLFDGYQ